MRQTLCSTTFRSAGEAISEVYRKAQDIGGVEIPALHIEEGDGGWCAYSTFPEWSYDGQDKPITLTIIASLDHPTEYEVEVFIHD